MINERFLKRCSSKQTDKSGLVKVVARDPALIGTLMCGLESTTAATRYGCGKVLLLVSEKHAELVYPHLESFAEMLTSDKNVLRWQAMAVIANLAPVDSENQIDSLINLYLKPVLGPTLIAAANSISGAARIAVAKPDLTRTVVGKLLKVESAHYEKPDCLPIAIGKAIEACGMLFPQSHRKDAILRFVGRQVDSAHSSVRNKAQKWLKRLAKINTHES